MALKAFFVVLVLGISSAVSELVDVSIHHNSRDTEKLPRSLNARFKVGDKDVNLNLRRNANVESDVPLLLIEGKNGKVDKVEERSADYAVYNDLEKHAVISVRAAKDKNSKRTLEGSFIHGNTHYEIRSASDDEMHKRQVVTRQLINPHFIEKKSVYDEDLVKKETVRSLLMKKRGSQKKEYLVEVVFFIDVSIYNRYMKKNNDDETKALNEIRYRYMHMANGMDMAYQRIASIDIGVRLTSLYVAKDNAASAMTVKYILDGKTYSKGMNPKTLKIDGYKTLDVIYKWGKDRKLKFDHIMVWTLFDLAAVDASGPSDVIGLSPLGGGCSDQEISVCEDTGFHAWSTAAHELGHNLGMNHDGEDGNKCKPTKLFIMTPASELLEKTTRDNAFKFSPCSEKEVQKFVSKSENNKCLKVADTDNIPADLKKFLETLPGQKYDIAQQCKFTHGEHSVPCGWNDKNFKFEDMCYALLCTDKKGYCSPSDLYAARGTTCGAKKWCQNGRCVSDPKAGSFKNPTCPFGDDVTYSFTNANDNKALKCDAPGLKEQWCEDPDIKRACCGTCGGGNPTTGGSGGAATTKSPSTSGGSGSSGGDYGGGDYYGSYGGDYGGDYSGSYNYGY